MKPFNFCSSWALEQTKSHFGDRFKEPPWSFYVPEEELVHNFWVRMHNLAMTLLTGTDYKFKYLDVSSLHPKPDQQ